MIPATGSVGGVNLFQRLSEVTGAPPQWWSGKCHITPFVALLFPQKPYPIIVNQVRFEMGDLSALLHLLTEKYLTALKQANPPPEINTKTYHSAQLSPHRLIEILGRTLGSKNKDSAVIVDIVPGPVVWNHLIQRYHVAVLPSQDEALKVKLHLAFVGADSVDIIGIIKFVGGKTYGSRWLSRFPIDRLTIVDTSKLLVVPWLQQQSDPQLQFIYAAYQRAISSQE